LHPGQNGFVVFIERYMVKRSNARLINNFSEKIAIKLINVPQVAYGSISIFYTPITLQMVTSKTAFNIKMPVFLIHVTFV